MWLNSLSSFAAFAKKKDYNYSKFSFFSLNTKKPLVAFAHRGNQVNMVDGDKFRRTTWKAASQNSIWFNSDGLKRCCHFQRFIEIKYYGSQCRALTAIVDEVSLPLTYIATTALQTLSSVGICVGSPTATNEQFSAGVLLSAACTAYC